MLKPASSIDLWRTSLELWHLGVETQMIVSMRLLGMAGIWSVSPLENRRMVGEKLPAFSKSARAAGDAVMNGKRPDQVLAAAIGPLRGKTRANSRRLVNRGPNRLLK